jgi:hypothetical protein
MEETPEDLPPLFFSLPEVTRERDPRIDRAAHLPQPRG